MKKNLKSSVHVHAEVHGNTMYLLNEDGLVDMVGMSPPDIPVKDRTQASSTAKKKQK